MGGTRMENSPEYGVVDDNCQVLRSENLFIVGSSIFTTSGHNNPTLPIVQVALRLAQFIVNRPAWCLPHREADGEICSTNYLKPFWHIVVEPNLDTADSTWALVFQVLTIT